MSRNYRKRQPGGGEGGSVSKGVEVHFGRETVILSECVMGGRQYNDLPVILRDSQPFSVQIKG